MRYFSEETVEELLTEANRKDWGERKPIDLNNYPSIEIKEPHGDLIERDDALTALMYAICGTGYQSMAMREIRSEMTCPTIIEATEERKR